MRAVSLAVVAILLLSGCAAETHDEDVDRAIGFLQSQQNADGGFPGTSGGPSDFSTSAWVALAFAAAETSGEPVTRLRGYLGAQRDAVESNQTGAFSAIASACMFVMAAEALGDPTEIWGATDPVGRLITESENGSLALNEKLFILGAIGMTWRSEAIVDIVNEVKAGLDDPAHELLAKDAWFRATAILALLRSGEDDDSPKMRAWAQSLLEFQENEAGFRAAMEYPADASTTANVVGVLSHVIFVYSSERVAGAEFLRMLQQPDGSVKFSREADFARVKTTAEAVLGWTGKGPFVH